MTDAYDEAVERVRVAKERGVLRPSTDPSWLITARTVVQPLRVALRCIQTGDLGDAELWVARAWQSIAWAHESLARDASSSQ